MTDTLSVDFYGSLTKDPDLWQDFMQGMRLRGNNIYVISGPPRTELERGLEYLGFIHEVHYDGVYSIISDLMDAGQHCWFDEDHDSWYTNEGLWWQRKAIICDRLSVSIHMDSDMRFRNFFRHIPTRFAHIDNRFLIQIRKISHQMKQEDSDWDEGDEYAYMYGAGGI